MNIIFNIENQTINCIGNYRIAADSREYLKAKFIFTSDWDGCVKTAVFSGSTGTYEMLLKNDECAVPNEVLAERFAVSVYGVNGTRRITTDTVYVAVQQSGFAEGETPSDPTPTVYEQLLNEIEVNKQTAETAAAEEKTAREEADAELRTDVDTEIAERKAADAELSENKADKTAITNMVNRHDVSALPSESVTYDFSDGVSRFKAVERMTVSVADGVQVITSASNAGNKYGLAHFDFGSISDNAARLIIDYDTKYDGGRWDIGLVDLSKRPGTSDKVTYDDTGVAYRAGTRDGTNYWINGTNEYDTSLNGVWVHTHVDIDMSAGTLKYEVSVAGTLKYTDEISVPDSVETVDGIEIYTWTSGTVFIDNITVSMLGDIDANGMYVTPDGEYIYKDGEPVKLGGEVDLSGYYTKNEMDDLLDEKAAASALGSETNARISAVSELESDIGTVSDTVLNLNETVSGHSNAIAYLENNTQTKIQIVSESGAEAEVDFDQRTETRCGELLTLTCGAYGSQTPDGWEPETLSASVIFTSGSVATQLIGFGSIKMFGTDCSGGTFVPQTNMRYRIDVKYDGAYVVGEVAGYPV